MVVPQLPAELSSHIIKLAHPSPRISASSRERFDDLLNSALVSQIWREIAQRELFRDVELRGMVGARLFCDSAEGTTAHLRGDVKSLRLSLGVGVPNKALKKKTKLVLERLMPLIPNVEELHFWGTDGLRLAPFASLPALQHIHLHNTSISKTDYSDIQFPALCELSLLAADPPSLLPLLAASVFPHLSIFSIILFEPEQLADEDEEEYGWAELELESLTPAAAGGEDFLLAQGEAESPPHSLDRTDDGGAPRLRKISIPSTEMYEYWLETDVENLASFCEEHGIELVESMECWPTFESKVERRTFRSAGEIGEVKWLDCWEGPPELWRTA